MNKIVKRVLIISGIAVGTIVLAAGSFVGYVLLSYYRIGNTSVGIDSHATNEVAKIGQTYKALSYNIGFGAYSQDFTFFLDEGYDINGNKTCGHSSWAKSKEEVLKNVNGAINVVAKEKPNFVFFQEVDTDSTRSYRVNQDKMIQDTFTDYDHIHCSNFHTSFLPYPLYQMHGIVNSGLTTISNLKLNDAKRVEYTVSTEFNKYFDLDRCFCTSYVEVENGKKLYIVNSHMSAYDEGGKIRSKQVAELNSFLSKVKENGDYAVVGGDWNHDLLTNNPDFHYDLENKPFGVKLKDPDWISPYFNSEKMSLCADGFKVVTSDNHPTCRNNDIEYEEGVTYVCNADGFVVSENINVKSCNVIQTEGGNKNLKGFSFSDHDPIEFEFELM